MATQRWQDIVFGGALDFTLDIAVRPTTPDFFVDDGQVALARFGTMRQPPLRLWLALPRIRFRCTAVAGGTEDLTAWRVGLLQSISHATWAGHYANGERLSFRLNTDHGPVKDGGLGTLFYRGGCRLRAGSTPGISETSFDDEDSPNVSFWREFSGNPNAPGAGTSSRLLRTEGDWQFHTFLAAVNESARVVVTLAECHWSLSWRGAYDFDARTWQPSDPEAMIAHHKIDQAGLYENPASASTPPPFSLFLDEGLQVSEVETQTGWVLCRDSRPSTNPKDPPTFQRWGM